jgi:Rad3-related DNA helicase
MITDEESIKRGLKDIKEGRTFNEVQIRAISELLKIKDKEYSQKIKELENRLDTTRKTIQDRIKFEDEQEKYIQKLKSQLNSQTGKIKELIKHFDFIGSGGDNYAKHVVKRLKSLLENELCDMSLISEETGKEYPCSFKRNHKGLHSFEDSRNLLESEKTEGLISNDKLVSARESPSRELCDSENSKGEKTLSIEAKPLKDSSKKVE